MDAVTRGQLAAVRRTLLRLHLAVCGVLLVAGILVPFQYQDAGADDPGLTLVTIFGVLTEEGEPVVFLIGFAGLLLSTLVALAVVLLQWDGRRSPRVQTVGKVVGVLMVVGAVVPAFAGVLSGTRGAGAAGPGMLFYCAGALVFLVVMYSEELDVLRHD